VLGKRKFGARFVEDLAADDFESLRSDIAKSCGPVRLGNEIVRCKSVFKYASDNRLIEKPVNFGSEFRKPNKKVMRKHKAESDQKLFEACEIRRLLNEAVTEHSKPAKALTGSDDEKEKEEGQKLAANQSVEV